MTFIYTDLLYQKPIVCIHIHGSVSLLEYESRRTFTQLTTRNESQSTVHKTMQGDIVESAVVQQRSTNQGALHGEDKESRSDLDLFSDVPKENTSVPKSKGETSKTVKDVGHTSKDAFQYDSQSSLDSEVSVRLIRLKKSHHLKTYGRSKAGNKFLPIPTRGNIYSL